MGAGSSGGDCQANPRPREGVSRYAELFAELLAAAGALELAAAGALELPELAAAGTLELPEERESLR